MKKESWLEVFDVFRAAVDLDAEGRARLLEERCSQHPELRRQVESLLVQDASGFGFLDRGALLEAGALDAVLDAGADAEPEVCPQRIGDFEILRVLDSGGMGTVYEAQQDRPRRRVALKTLRGLAGSADARKRLLFEAEVLGALRHPAIAQIHAAGVHLEGRLEVPWIAMEFVAGARDLARYAREEGLDLRARADLVRRACEAVAHGHRLGVIHRDLKPANLLVDADGALKVIDFGLARATDAGLDGASMAETLPGQVAGTLRYMAPEQFGGRREELTVQCDVWALGTVLFELASGVLPFEYDGKSLTQVATMVEGEEPRRLRAVAPDVPRELDWICAAALEPDRARRTASVEELGRDLARFASGDAVSAAPPSAAYRARKLVRKHRLAVSSAAAVTAALVTGLVTTLWQARVARARLEERNVQLEVAGEASGFLSRVLRAMDPEAHGPDVSVREVIEEAERQLAAAPPGRPEVAQAVARDLGTTWARMGFMARAEPLLRRAAEGERELYGADDERSIASALDWFEVRLELGEATPLLALTEETTRSARFALGATHPLSLRARAVEARARFDAGEFEGALARLEATARDMRAALGATDPLTLDTHALLAQTLDRASRSEEAIDVLDAVLADTDPTSPLGLERERQLSHILMNVGRLPEAEERVRRLLPELERVFGAQTVRVIQFRAFHARLLLRMGRADAAEPLLDEVLAACRAWTGAEPVALRTAMNVCGTQLVHMGRPDDGAELLRRASDARLRAGETANDETYHALSGLALAHSANGDLAGALELLLEAVPAATRDLGAGNRIALHLRANLANAYSELALYDDAVRELESMLPVARESLGAEDVDIVQNNEMLLGACLRDRGDYAAAESLLSSVLERSARLLGEDHGDTQDVRFELARIFAQRGDRARATELYRDILERDSASPNLEAKVMILLADAERVLGNLDQARDWLERTRDLQAGWPPSATLSRVMQERELGLAMGDWDYALAASAQCLRVGLPMMPEGNERAEKWLARHARCVFELHGVDAGLALLEDELGAREEALGWEARETRDAARTLAHGLERAGQPEAAADLRDALARE